MGSGASHHNLEDSPVKKALENLHVIRAELGSSCRVALNMEKAKTFKAHSVVISTLCGHHTKATLEHNVILDNGKADGLTTNDLYNLGGDGTYAEFLYRLPQSLLDLNVSDLHIAVDGKVGIDAEGMLRVLVTNSAEDNAAAVNRLKEMGIDLVSIVSERTRTGSLLRIALLALLGAGGQCPPGTFEGPDAVRKAEQLMTCDSDEDLIPQLIMLHRGFLAPVLNALMDQNSSFAILLENVGGLRRYILALLHDTPAASVGALCLDQMKNPSACSRIISRFDARTLKEASAFVHKHTGASLVRMLSKGGMGGHLLQVVTAWAEQNSPVVHAEHAIQAFIENELKKDGLDLAGIVANEELSAHIDMIVGKACGYASACAAKQEELNAENEKNAILQEAESKSAMEAAKTAKIEAAQDAELDRQAAEEAAEDKERSERTDDPEATRIAREAANPLPLVPVKPRVRPILRQQSSSYSANELPDNDGDTFNDKYTLVTSFLTEIFAAADSDNDGYIDQSNFWKIFCHLDIANLCYSEEELAFLPEMTESELVYEGKVWYAEVVPELADGIISALEENSLKVRETIQAETADASLDKLQAMTDACSKDFPMIKSDVSQLLPPMLLTYLETTIHAFDTEKKGYLNRDDFWKLLNLLSLNILETDTDFENFFVSCDANEDGGVTAEEALPKFTDLLHDIASDCRDHWIGLEDTTTNPSNCFWYNLLDGMSQWMTADEQENYLSHRANDNNYDTGVFSSGPNIRKRFVSKVGLIKDINRLRKGLASNRQHRERILANESMDPDARERHLAKIELDYQADLSALKKQHGQAARALQQRLDASKDVHARKLRERLDMKKKKILMNRKSGKKLL